jgi:hypothetical protein
MAVVRLRAKIDTSVTPATARSTPRVPTIAMPPTTSGRAPATTLPKTRTCSTSVTGTAIDSALARSLLTWPVTWRLISARPPTATPIGPPVAVSSGPSSVTRSITASSSPVMRARIMARLPSSPFSGARLPFQ